MYTANPIVPGCNTVLKMTIVSTSSCKPDIGGLSFEILSPMMAIDPLIVII
jgi:hypothetical protein